MFIKGSPCLALSQSANNSARFKSAHSITKLCARRAVSPHIFAKFEFHIMLRRPRIPRESAAANDRCNTYK